MMFRAEARCGPCWSAAKTNGIGSKGVDFRRLRDLWKTALKSRPSARQRHEHRALI